LCRECREPYTPKQDELPKDFPWDELQEHGGQLMRHRGCRACRHVGYLGRVGIYELLVSSERVRTLAHERCSTWDIRKAALEEGMLTLRQDGWQKVVEGRTSVEEVVRVTKSDRL
jgi:general secretion pathway protein E/type IV pilus assembly protein PilB